MCKTYRFHNLPFTDIHQKPKQTGIKPVKKPKYLLNIQQKNIYTKNTIIYYIFNVLAYYLINKIIVSKENILKKK
ncbi:hypothetical protein DCO46_21545 [Flavobacterium sp. HTF]|nr:hypothetical protein DCO46_21545 [Flavobacterium sp. HTF]